VFSFGSWNCVSGVLLAVETGRLTIELSDDESFTSDDDLSLTCLVSGSLSEESDDTAGCKY